jgi:acyl-CoA synthetase (AMP-forming)/AMP-acid ligase II
VYIGTPIYHGFGVATVFAAMALGARLYLRRHFDAAEACELVAAQKIEVLTLVPLMLKRMLQHSPQSLSSVQAYLTGGAPLRPDVVLLAEEKIGAKLFNLYGTSEAGFCIMATPQDLSYSALTIGRPVQGVKLHILDANNKELGMGKVGRLSVKAGWSVKKAVFIETGDLGYRDAQGYIFLCGRTDDMIVSGGENVYPIELENILLQHPDIEQVAVLGIEDVDFGQRLRAFVQLKPNADLPEAPLLAWLKSRCTRYQMPREIVFVAELPYTVLGKINKNKLR